MFSLLVRRLRAPTVMRPPQIAFCVCDADLAYANLPFYKTNGVGEWAWKRVEDTGLLNAEEVAILRTIPSEYSSLRVTL